MNAIVERLCQRLGQALPTEANEPCVLKIDQRNVAIYRVHNPIGMVKSRHFIYGEIALPATDVDALALLGRIGLSWAAGSGISIGLHPDEKDIAVVGCGLDDLNDSAEHVEHVLHTMRRIASAMTELECYFAPHSSNVSSASDAAVHGDRRRPDDARLRR